MRTAFCDFRSEGGADCNKCFTTEGGDAIAGDAITGDAHVMVCLELTSGYLQRNVTLTAMTTSSSTTTGS